jgi:glucosyl-3-phosphoglycerate synthase
VRDDVTAWLNRRSSLLADWPAASVLAGAGGTTVAVVVPALNEEATVAAVVRAARRLCTGGDHPAAGLVDEVVVMDSGSTDGTAAAAAGAGARVVTREDVVPEFAPVPGKGEVLWRSLAATDADVLVFVDADLRSFTPDWVVGLVGPMLADPTVHLVKGAYHRPLELDGLPTGTGGRVTELVARPLLGLHWPQLTGVAQPLGGEYAVRRSLAERLPFPTGYGVELGLLVDTWALCGLDALAQVDLGVRRHRHHDDQRLGRMAAEIWRTALDRLDREGRVVVVEEAGDTIVQHEPTGPVEHVVRAIERPPMLEIASYRERVTAPRA